MGLTRRELLAGAGGCALAACASVQKRADPPKPQKILVLGGTGFVGPPLVRAALARGHAVTLFNRGKTHPGLFPEVETILGDRMTQLDLLKGRDWDAVVDTWAPGPTLVRRAAELLQDHVRQYVFLSTISVYKLGREDLDETSPVLELPPGTKLTDIKAIDATNYGPLKVLAERAAEELLPGRATAVRAGLIAGPGDPTGRFTYWPARLARGGEMIAPGTPEDRMQFIDVRDLGEWMVTAIEHRAMGTYNAVGPEDPHLGAILSDLRTALHSDTKLTWVGHDWLDQHQASGWDHFPIAVPPKADDAGFARVRAARAVAQGLRFRPPGQTGVAALETWNALPAEEKAKLPGISAAEEASLLGLWHAQSSQRT